MTIWFKGFFWRKIIEFKCQGILIIFKEDSSISYLNREFRIYLCRLISKIICGSDYKKYLNKITIFLTNERGKSYRYNSDFPVSNLIQFSEGKVDMGLLEKGVANIIINVDNVWANILDILRSKNVPLTKDINETYERNKAMIQKILSEILNEAVLHELFHNVQFYIESKQKELHRLGSKYLSAIKWHNKIWLSFLMQIKRFNFSLAYIYIRKFIAELIDIIKVEGEAKFFSETKTFELDMRSIEREYKFGLEDAKLIQREMDRILDMLESMINEAIKQSKNKPFLSQKQKRKEIEKYFIMHFNISEISNLGKKIHSQLYQIGASMIQCILFVLGEYDLHKIVKLSSRKLVLAYEIACQELKIIPLVTYDGDGIFDVKRNIRRLVRLKHQLRKLP